MVGKNEQKRLLIADSGGTKTDWVFLVNGKVSKRLNTPGLNPSLIDPESIRQVLRDQVSPWIGDDSPTQTYFFGAGLNRKPARIQMDHMLRKQLNLKSEISVQPDMIGAAYSCLKRSKGVVGILGTGSVAFRYNGERITKQKGGLGYLIGDVGGGVALGRVFLRRLVNKDFPESLLHAYSDYSGLAIKNVLGTLYNHVAPAKFLAAQVPFIFENRGVEEIRQIVMGQFSGFLDVYLMPLAKKKDPVVFLGGVARAFKEELLELCAEKGIKKACIHLDPPIEGLAEFFGSSNFNSPRIVTES